MIRLARGSGVYGLGAIRQSAWLDEIALARPLLDVERALLHRVADDSGLACVDDPSNRDSAFDRIRWRALLPQIADAGATGGRIAETAKRMQRAADALDHYASRLLQTYVRVDEFGSATADTLLFQDAPEEVRLRAFARLLQAVGGSDYTPRLDRLEHLLAAIRAEIANSGDLRRTLNGCVIDLKSGQLRVYREWGRAGPGQLPVTMGPMVWDGRFLLALPSGLPDGIVAGPLGDDFRDYPGSADAAVLRTVPGLFAGKTLFAAPQIEAAESHAGSNPFKCRSLVENRLLNPRNSLADAVRQGLC
jgi:tRNA(Ile)-lysidine synthase